jgi:hypothetical protein
MIICPLAAQHQLFALPEGGVNRKVSIRSWHASACADAATITATPISTRLPQGDMTPSLLDAVNVWVDVVTGG